VNRIEGLDDSQGNYWLHSYSESKDKVEVSPITPLFGRAREERASFAVGSRLVSTFFFAGY
jgi:hypothetical protein